MILIKTIFALVFLVLMLVAGVSFLLLAGDVLSLDQWTEVFGVITGAIEYQIALGVAGGIFVIIGVFLPLWFIKVIRKSRFITIKNPDGEVVISISAVEEYVRKIAMEMPDVNTIRSKVIFSKKGIKIISSITIQAGSSVSEITESIRMGIKDRVNSMLGLDTKINVAIRVEKIIGEIEDKDVLPAEE